LETRALLSAAGPVPAPVDLDTLTAHPDLTASPLAGAGSMTYYSAGQIRQAYAVNVVRPVNGVPITGAGQTIAIVDAYGDPSIVADANVFSLHSGLPTFNTAGGPTLTVAQPGGPAATDVSWAGETSLDVEWAHAIAPNANILLVEAPSNNYADLLGAVHYAANQPGVVAVSMSWGSSEFSSESAYDSTFTTPAGHLGGSAGTPGAVSRSGGITFVAAAGDSGAWYGPQWPAVAPSVLAVGGTSLYLDSASYYAGESGWSGSGGGYSRYETEPDYQRSVQSSGWRSSPDVAYNADPNTGFIVYDTIGVPPGYSGWWVFGGTSAGAPQWAAIVALADQARALHGEGSLGNAQSQIYNLSGADFHDIVGGSNGYPATRGYDLVTGRGTPLVDRVVADLAGDPLSIFRSILTFRAASPSAEPVAVNASAAGHGEAASSLDEMVRANVLAQQSATALPHAFAAAIDAGESPAEVGFVLASHHQDEWVASIAHSPLAWKLGSHGLSPALVEQVTALLTRSEHGPDETAFSSLGGEAPSEETESAGEEDGF
jgi:subtilase family serine protease